jgi:FtsP/CotA-like multicopper oxidase with cupredoxin domain
MNDEIPRLNRRKFVKSAAAAGLLAGFGGIVPAYARPGRNGQLGGSSVDLRIGEQDIEIDGRRASAMAVNGTLPGPLVRLREGQDALIRVTNQLANANTSIHWHGLILPFRMDGVPGVSYAGIRPGETFTYHFPVRQNGTYWYHSHSADQEQLGVYGPLIIDAPDREPFRFDREYVVMLGDWLWANPAAMLDKLKKDSSYSNY